jgi:DNA-binding transcriptional LysR family regulator
MHQVDLRGVDLNLLTLLEALFETRSVTQAGDRLDLSQPAASRALGRLRRMLGDPLFVRGADGLVPTRHAETLRAPLAQSLASARLVIAPPRFDPATATGAVRLIIPDVDAATLVPRLLAAFAQSAPGLDIVLPPRGRDTFAMLADDAADLGVGVFDAAPAGFRRQRLYSDTMVCVVRRGHPVLKRGLTLERFRELRHVLITITGEGGGVVDAALAARGLSRRIALRIPSFLAAPLVVARSDLIVTLPRRTAAEFAALAPLVLVEPPLKLAGFDVSQLWHERHHADPRHAWLRRVLVSVVRGASEKTTHAGKGKI